MQAQISNKKAAKKVAELSLLPLYKFGHLQKFKNNEKLS